jgi:NADPH-dependent 2,4-dienoyl-CoA reductase/sulfur reductase-like enzyme
VNQVAIVGAGPAGLSAAVAALKAGATVTLLDSSNSLGGQFWRHLPSTRPAARESRLHHEWDAYLGLSSAVMRNPRCEILTGAQVWAIDHTDGQLRLQLAIGEVDGVDRRMETLVPDALVLATGAHDHTLPFPGWDLPGVFTGGAAQALAKSERVAVGERVVVAGAGPFLLPVAAALAATGSTVLGVHEASRISTLTRGWVRGASALATMPNKLGELAGYATAQLRERIPYHLGSAVVAAQGRDAVESVTVARVDSDWRPIVGSERTIACDAVAVSHGFTARLELAVAAGCALGPGGPSGRFVVVDADQRTSVPGVFAAGEVTGIGGADAALREGALAGWVAAGGAPDDRRANSARRGVRRFKSFERSLAEAHGIRSGWTGWLSDDTTICRCEEVSYGRLRTTAEATAARGLRSLKLTTRAGLGPCQGRMCGRAVEAIAVASGGPLLDDASIDHRPFAAPIRFAELARIPDERHQT